MAKVLVQKILTLASLRVSSSFTSHRSNTNTELTMEDQFDSSQLDADQNELLIRDTWLRNYSNRKESLMVTEPITLVDNDLIRLTAKKLVRKVLRVAFFRIDGRRSSIEMEYIVNNTKKLKLDSTSTPPPLSPQAPPPPLPSLSPTFSPLLSTSSSSQQFFDSGIIISSSPPHASLNCDPEQTDELLRKLGKRRQRSESHDAGSLREGGINGKLQPLIPRVYSEPVIIEENETTPLSPHGNGGLDKLTNLIVDLSISEDTRPIDDSNDDNDDNGDYIVIEAITKMVDISPDRLSPTLPTHSHNSVPDMNYSGASLNHLVPDMDYYIMVHPSPPPGLCQKFMCNNTNEVNILYHTWLFPDITFDPSISELRSVHMGLFDPVGVAPVHLDLKDSGVSFYYLEERFVHYSVLNTLHSPPLSLSLSYRTVCIHSCCFSPENAQFQIVDYNQVCSFYSVARHNGRRVVVFHIILPPSYSSCEKDIKKCNDLVELLKCFNVYIPLVSQKVHNLLYPLFC